MASQRRPRRAVNDAVDTKVKQAQSLSSRRVTKAIAAMPAPLASKYNEARDLLCASVGRGAEARHRIGAIVVDVMADVDRYGERGVALLAQALGRNEDTLYEWGKVAAAWTESAFHALLARRTVHGMPLSISHLVVLSSIRDSEARAAATEQALSEGLSVKRLRDGLEGTRDSHAQDAEEDDQTAGGRRILARLSKCAGTAVRRTSKLVASLETIPEDELDDASFVDLLARGVEDTRGLMKELGGAVERLETRLRTLTHG